MKTALKTQIIVAFLVLQVFGTPVKKKFLVNGEPTLRGITGSIFSDTETRSKIDLSGEWLCKIEGEKEWSSVLIPSAYDFTGTVIFRRNFEIPADLFSTGNFILVAYGINYECEISINGEFLKRHTGGYTSFTAKIPKSILYAGTNTIEIKVSNKLNSRNTIPLRHQVWAWRNYGGIFRDIFILVVPLVWIDDVKLDYTISKDYSRIKGNFEAYVFSGDLSKHADLFDPKAGFSFRARIYDGLTGRIVSESEVFRFIMSDFRSIKVNVNFSLFNPKLWSPDEPNLYLVRCQIYQGRKKIDEVIFTTGFREVKILNSDIYLNGKKLVLKGVSRHEDHPRYGSAMTYEEMEKDIVRIKNLGANVIRLAHYPQHPFILDLCDRYGLFVMEEIPVWNVPADILVKNNFIELAKSYIKEMILRDKLHPSVLAWGIGNEFDSADKKARKYVIELNGFVKSLDKRPTYYASRMVKNDVCMDIVDLACVNIYVDDLNKFKELISFWKRRYSSKPVVVTEYGKAVQLGNRNGFSDPLSYESQAKYIEERYKAISEAKYDGSLVWIYADWLGDRPILTLPNPNRYLYTMGLVSYEREKRPAYDVVKALYTDGKIPSLSIGDHNPQNPIIFTIFGTLLLLAFSYINYNYRWFRENLNRAILRPYNFFADIRDQYLIASWQTLSFALIISIAVGTFWGAIFYKLRSSEVLDYILTHLVFYDPLKEKISVVLWKPFELSVYLSALSLIGLVVLSFLINLFSKLAKANINLNHSFNVVVWSTTFLLLLIPVDMVVAKVVNSPTSIATASGLALILHLLSAFRLIRGISITYEAKYTKVLLSVIFIVVLVLGVTIFVYDYKFSTLSYIKFLVHILQSLK